jgi:di/tricarboxylate transporter
MNSDAIFQLQEQLLALRIPPESGLVGKTLAESRLGEAFDLAVMGIARAGKTDLLPSPDTRLQADDTLLIEGRFEDVSALGGLQLISLMPAQADSLESLEGDEVGFVEVVLSPHTTLAGRTLTELHFREKYGLTVVAIWRSGQPYTAGLQKMPLQFGDALLVQGPWSRIKVLAAEPDYIVLAEAIQDPPRLQKAPLAVLIMLGVVAVVLTGWLPLVISAVAGAALMVLTGCLSMEEAYQNIEWRTVFLIAGMLPLGIAMEHTGTAAYLADSVVAVVGGLGPRGVMVGLFVLTTLLTAFMSNAAAAVLVVPIAISAAATLGVAPQAFAMSVGMAASNAFVTPVSHQSNVLVYGPGGYRFFDFTKVGLPLTMIGWALMLIFMPIFWPF